MHSDYLRKIIVQGKSPTSTRVGDIMTDEVVSCIHGNVLYFQQLQCLNLCPVSFNLCEQSKLITVAPDTKILQAMQLMTGK